MRSTAKSIFTGGSQAAPEVLTAQNHRRGTTEDDDTLPETVPSTPPIPLPLEKPFAPQLNQPSWTPHTPFAVDKHSSHQATDYHYNTKGLKRVETVQETWTRRTPPVVAGKKRPGIFDSSPSRRPEEVTSEPLLKRRRVASSRHRLDHYGVFDKSVPVQLRENSGQPTSPLFFSYSQHSRPRLPARFSSSEAAARMLSKSREDSGVKVVTLARGSFSGLSPPGQPPPSSLSAMSSDRSSLPPPSLSNDSRESSDPLRLLASVGVIELLELDARPTFIVDIGDEANYAPDPSSLQILFANSALRSSPTTWELVVGKVSSSASDEPRAHASNQFRRWLLKTTVPGESLAVNPSPVEHGGIVWTCNTLRKRLRIVSGVVPAPPAASIPSTTTLNEFFVPSPLSARTSGARAEVHPALASEPQDYFGGTIATGIEDPMQSVNLDHSVEEQATILGRSELPTPSHPSFTNETEKPARVQDVGFFDWTRLPLTSTLPSHIEFARSIDWANTPLGPIEYWPNDLRTMCNLIMASPHPAAMYWGEELVAIYNEAYIGLAGQKHPTLMGQSYKVAWAEIWDDVKDVFENARVTGQATMKDDDCLFMKRSGFIEETYFSWSIIPMVGEDGTVTGLYNPAFEKAWEAVSRVVEKVGPKRSLYLPVSSIDATKTGAQGTAVSGIYAISMGLDDTSQPTSSMTREAVTLATLRSRLLQTRRKIAERRMLTLREVGERTATARDVKGFWQQVLLALTENEMDTPFLLLYSVSDENDSDSSSLYSNSLIGSKHCYLEGSLGVPCGHVAAPDHFDLREGHEGFGPVLREVMKTDKPVVVSIGSGDLPSKMMEGLEWRGFGDACREVVVCPIHPTTGESILGFLIMGINPRRPYDDDYNLFIQLLSRQLATSLASVVLFEEEIRRGQKAAKLAAEDRFHLSEQLAARTQEALDSETRFTRMTEYSPAGLFIADHAGRITYCNDTWYEISRVPKEPEKTDKWMEYVREEDQKLIQEQWKQLVDNADAINIEFRFKTPWSDRSGNEGDTWVLFCAFPEKYEDGMLKSVFGSITNISSQKWAEGFQKRKMEEAVELKRQQENFIDMTSHEMRNPLSAILQCADEISTILGEFKTSGAREIPPRIVTDSIDAAQTIALCGQHQKRIVDDVLTLSKIDSAMLMVTPVDAQPLQVVQRALRMFEGEVQTAGIQMEFVTSDSFRDLGIDWVKLDPSRVLQVLINLTTNAIKFTTTEPNRTIKVILSASKERPSSTKSPCVSFFPSRSKREDQTLGHDWGKGEEIYLEFTVQDTGRGLSEDEKKLLFQRFSQASPRTHVTYGGSGLGLFISRELTELQGGEIGVSSEAGKGSTFSFYVKCRRTTEPKVATETLPLSLVRHLSNAKDRARPTPPKVRDFAAIPKNTSSVHKIQEKKTGLKVLIVEDNLVNQKVLQRQLENRGITTYVANHGGEALEKLKQSTFWKGHGPDAVELGVVLMDKEMPVMDGLECTSKIREFEAQNLLNRHVPIIAVTANARSEQIATLLAAGMDDVVSKPFRIPELIPKIEELTSKFPDSLTDDGLTLVVPGKPSTTPYTI